MLFAGGLAPIIPSVLRPFGHDVAERRRHSLEASDVKLGSKAMVEFTIAIWKKKPERVGCTFHLISIGVLERAGDNVTGSFLSPKKRQRTGM